MKLNWQGFKTAWLCQLALYFACFCLWFYFRTDAYLAGPPDGDLYAQTWSFQLIVGAFYLVGSLPLLAILFMVEAGLFKAVLRVVHPQQGAQADRPASGGSSA